MIETISFTLNDGPVTLRVDRDRPLLWVLRTDLGLTGAKFGCGEGLCGACTVLINNEATAACQTSIGTIAGSDVRTIEGLAKNGRLASHPGSVVEHDALQIRFCTPGMILKARFSGLDPKPTRQQIIDGLE